MMIRVSSYRRAELSGRKLVRALLAPSILIILLVVVVPLLFAFYLSFHQAEPMVGGVSIKYIGLDNYQYFFRKAPLFWQSLKVTGYFTFLSLLVELALGISMALILNTNFFGRSVVRALVLLPWAVPTVVNARLWEWIYAGANFGALNGLMKTAGVIPLDQDIIWLSFNIPFREVPVLGDILSWFGATSALHMIILADTWKVTPLVTLLVLAGLQNIPEGLYEAATIDGASAWKRFWSITMPLLKPVLLVILVLRTMELFRVFDIIYIIMQYSIRTLGVYTYEVGMKFLHFGRGSALSFLVGLIIFGLALVYIKLLYTEEEHS